jgi:PhzF family phenazine biosynthesis protein
VDAAAEFHVRRQHHPQQGAFRMQMYQVDAFTDRVFAGNPAAVLILDDWLPDGQMLAIAQENNLAETAFVKACPGA